MCWLA